MQVELFKKTSNYVDSSTGRQKTAVSFYLRCGSELVPIQVRYFGKDDKQDYQYKARKLVLSSFSDVLEEKSAPANSSETA